MTVRYHQFAGEWQSWRDGFERRLSERAAVDLDPLLTRPHGVEAAITPLQPRLDQVHSAVRAIEIPKPQPTDLAPLLAAVAGIHIPPQREPDLNPLHDRLAALEQALRDVPAPAPVPAPHVRAGSRNLLVSAVHGKPDNLQKIHGVAHGRIERDGWVAQAIRLAQESDSARQPAAA
ncbi:MAG: hypothetical protein KGN16_02525 [Burkholderiales bacterium]|nr:hypothetical protein [Burkholderiales bacterium]